MVLFPTKTFQRDYEKLPKLIQRQLDRNLEFLLKNPTTLLWELRRQKEKFLRDIPTYLREELLKTTGFYF